MLHAVAAVFLGAVAFVGGLLGFGPTTIPSVPQTQMAAVAEIQYAPTPAEAIATNTITDAAARSAAAAAPAPIETGRVLGDSTVTMSPEFLVQFTRLLQQLQAYLATPTASQSAYPRYGGYLPQSDGTTALASPTITGGTISGASSGSFDALSAGTLNLSGTLTGTDATFSGTLTAGTLNVAGVSSGGAITGPYFTATSTTASSFIQASSTRFSIFDKAYFGGTSTTTIDSAGSITLPSVALLTAPYASTTAFSVSGTAYFPGSGIWNSSGNVGIGTTTPNAKLQVYGSSVDISTAVPLPANESIFRVVSSNTAALDFGSQSSSPFGMWLQARNNTGGGVNYPLLLNPNGGNVGIGTTSPATTFSTAGNGYFTGGLGVGLLNTTAGTLQTSGLITGGTILALSGTTGTSTIAAGQGFTIGSSQFVVQQGSGNVGAGTAEPVTGLHVLSTDTDGQLRLAWDASSYSNFATNLNGNTTFLSSGGNLWIGNANGAQSTAVSIYNSDSGNSTNGLTLGNMKTPTGSNIKINFVDWAGTEISSIRNIHGGTGIGSLAFYTNNAGASTERVRIDNQGKIGIGTTTPWGNLSIATGAHTYVEIGRGAAGNNAELVFSTNGAFNWAAGLGDDVSNSFYLSTNVATPSLGAKLTVTTGGNVGIGTTTPTAQLSTTGTVRFSNFGAGSLQTDANGNVSVSSDERLKHIQGAFSRGLAEIIKVSPIVYQWRPETGYDASSRYAGFSAQNVREAIPEAVGENPDGYLSLNDRPILAAVVNAIKELASSIASLISNDTAQDAEIAALKERIAALEARPVVDPDGSYTITVSSQTAAPAQTHESASEPAPSNEVATASATSTAPVATSTPTETPVETVTEPTRTTPPEPEVTPEDSGTETTSPDTATPTL